MQPTLFVPGLLLPDAIRNDTVFDLAAPAFSLLLGRGRRRELGGDWLPGAFGLAAPLPAAALRIVGAGGTALAGLPRDMGTALAGLPRDMGTALAGLPRDMGTAIGDWICLDPVHWLVAREGVTLADPMQLQLEAADAAALIDAIAPLFADWGKLSASAPACWELQLKQPLALVTTPLPEAVDQAIDPALPGGADGPAWRRLIAAAQSVLHEHPVNRSREALGRPRINSLWPWGAGSLPAAVQANFNVVWSADPVLAGLSAHAGMPCLAPPQRFQPASGRVLVVIDTLAQPARSFDALAWRDALLAVERDWIAPALASLRKRECQELRLIGTRIAGIAGPQQTVAFTLTRGERFHIWRRPQPLTSLA